MVVQAGVFGESVSSLPPQGLLLKHLKTLKRAEEKRNLQKHPFGQPFLRTTLSPLLWRAPQRDRQVLARRWQLLEHLCAIKVPELHAMPASDRRIRGLPRLARDDLLFRSFPEPPTPGISQSTIDADMKAKRDNIISELLWRWLKWQSGKILFWQYLLTKLSGQIPSKK